VPFSANVIDECSESLYCNAKKDNAKLFYCAESEALDFLAADAYLSFERTNTSVAARQKKGAEPIIPAIKANFTSTRRRSSMLKTTDHETMSAIAQKILSDPEYLTVFKIYMLGADSENLLYAYIEAVEVQERLSHLSASSGEGGAVAQEEEDVSMQIFLHYINAFYDTYLALGAPFRIAVTEATRAEVMRRVNKTRGNNWEALNPVIEECFETLIREHLDRFLSTTEYRQLVRSGRRSVAALSESLVKRPFKEQAAIQQELAALYGSAVVGAEVVQTHMGEQSGSSGSGDGNNNINSSSRSRSRTSILISNSHGLVELKMFIQSSYNGIFGAYLESHDKLPLMHFFQCATHFANTAFRNDMERVGECTCIFDRYISRNSEEQVGMPDAIRQEIVRFLFRSPKEIFDSAALWVLQVLFDQFWTSFKSQVLAQTQGITAALLDRVVEEEGGGKDQDEEDAEEKHCSEGEDMASGKDKVAKKGKDREWAKGGNGRGSGNGSGSGSGNGNGNGIASISSSGSSNISSASEQDLADFVSPEPHSSAVPVATLTLGALSLDKPLTADDLTEFARLAEKRFPTQLSDAGSLADSGPQPAGSGSRGTGNGTGGSSGASAGMGMGGGLSIGSAARRRSSIFGGLGASEGTGGGAVGAGLGPLRKLWLTAIQSKRANTGDAAVGTSINGPGAGAGAGAGECEGESLPLDPNDPNSSSIPGMAAKGEGLTVRSLRRYSLDKSAEREVSGALRPHRRRNSIGAPKIVDRGLELSSSARTSHIQALSQQASMRRGDSLHFANISSSNVGGSGSERVSSTKHGKLLREVLQHPQCCGVFKDFLERESSPQTLLFLLDIEEFKRIPNATFQNLQARKIFTKYIHEMAIFPVPLSAETRATVVSELSSASFGIFKAAGGEVLRYMEEYQFPDFVSSPDMVRVEGIIRGEGSAVRQKRRQSITIVTPGLADARSLRQILQHQTSTRFFKDFCMRTYINESLLFWLDADHYVNLPNSDYMKRTALKICRKFVFDRARMQINIGYETKQDILKNLADPQRFLFRRAQEEIFRLLDQDAMPKFAAGPEYRAMLKAIETQGVGGRGSGMGTPVAVLSKALTTAFGLV